jgi:hypothetical protein
MSRITNVFAAPYGFTGKIPPDTPPPPGPHFVAFTLRTQDSGLKTLGICHGLSRFVTGNVTGTKSRMPCIHWVVTMSRVYTPESHPPRSSWPSTLVTRHSSLPMRSPLWIWDGHRDALGRPLGRIKREKSPMFTRFGMVGRMFYPEGIHQPGTFVAYLCRHLFCPQPSTTDNQRPGTPGTARYGWRYGSKIRIANVYRPWYGGTPPAPLGPPHRH